MRRAQISIKLDQGTLRRVDEAAELLECTRTAFIERACERALNNLDATVEELERESPITAAVLDAIASNKKVMVALSKVIAQEMTEEQVAESVELLPRLRAEANRRQSVQKRRRKGGSDG